MTDTREWEQGRVLDRFRVNQEEAIQAIVKGLKAVGYSVDLSPVFALDTLGEPMPFGGKPVPFGAIITVYRKEKKTRHAAKMETATGQEAEKKEGGA